MNACVNVKPFTFQLDVHVLAKPWVDPIARVIFWDGVLSEPVSTCILVEVVTGLHSEVHLVDD